MTASRSARDPEDVRHASAAVRSAARRRDAAAREIAETVLAGGRADDATLRAYRALVADQQDAWRSWQAAVDGWDAQRVTGS